MQLIFKFFKVFLSNYNYQIAHHVYENFDSGLELNKGQTPESKCLTLKIRALEAIVPWFGFKKPSSATVNISAYFVGPECSVVVLQNVRFCLSIHLSVLPAFLEIRWNSLTFCFWLEIFKE